jgi:hypothetical protein
MKLSFKINSQDLINELKLFNQINTHTNMEDLLNSNEQSIIIADQNDNLRDKLRKQLFLFENDDKKLTINSDTKLAALGDLSIWEFTAIFLLFFLFLGNNIFSFSFDSFKALYLFCY